MSTNLVELLPFAIDRKLPASLVDQVFNAFSEAIRNGTYRVGDTLPTWRETARALGVSDRVIRSAMARLKARGLIVSHGRLGCVVARVYDGRAWKGVVLSVSDMDSAMTYSSMRRELETVKTLARAGMTLLSVVVESLSPTKAPAALSLIDSIMSFKVDFVLLTCENDRLARYLSTRGCPFAGLRAYNMPNCVGQVRGATFSRAIAAFVSRCRKYGVKSVLQVEFTASRLFDAVPQLNAAGVPADRWVVPCPLCRSAAEVRAAGERAFTKRLSEGREWLPEVLLFVDDYVAQGALTALTCSGVRIPQDVQVVTFSNVGNELAFPVRLTSICLDEARCGRLIAEEILHFQRTGKWLQRQAPCASYVEGETFPVKKKNKLGR